MNIPQLPKIDELLPQSDNGPKMPRPDLVGNWLNKVSKVDFAMQPIINPTTGICFGVEALIREIKPIGFIHPHELFDAAFADGVLFLIDVALREKAIAKFKQIPFHDRLILFYNYDPRILEMPDYRPGMTERLMANFDLSPGQICFEINEKYPIESHDVLAEFVLNMKGRGIRIALDDFGSGFAGMELFYHSDPGFLKFDRFLISRINSDARKKNICAHLLALCRVQGVTTIAEGIETEAEARVCKDIGFDLLQGFYIALPATNTGEILQSYAGVHRIFSLAGNKRSTDADIIRREILPIETIGVDDDVRKLLEKFHDEQDYNFFPVLDAARFPIGIVHERNIKQYVYSPYGRELLSNKSVTRGLRSFISHCPVTDIHTPQDKILEIYLAHPGAEGVIIVQDGIYFGFLNAKSLLNVVHEKNLAAARDMNPLTRLPGNTVINAFMNGALQKPHLYSYFIYIDFDYFKPFNDRFGFRQGDRAILLFAEILKRLSTPQSLIAHIGGDDFFMGLETDIRAADEMLELAENLRQAFEQEVKPFFSPEERAQGYYISTDRDNAVKKFPILSLSTAIVELKPGEKPEKPEEISTLMARLKKEAKFNAAGRAMGNFPDIG